MIDLDVFIKQYREATGFEIFKEEGDADGFRREHNTVVKPICGVFHINPISLTAIQRPFIGQATANIEVIAPPERWEEARDTMNAVAVSFNGTTNKFTDEEGTVYSVSYNCQTAQESGRIRDISLGRGEVFNISQVISYIIIEEGVSAYDVTMKIDGHAVPILTLVETKTHTASVYASDVGTGETSSDMEAYGVDFTTPFINSPLCRMFADAISENGGNNAHVVTIEKNGVTRHKIMQISGVSNSINPPQNVGINVSMTSVRPSIAEYSWHWFEMKTDKPYILFDATQKHLNIEPRKMVVFWGDGEAQEVAFGSSTTHVYTDESTSHTIRVRRFFDDDNVLVPITEALETGSFESFGKEIVFKTPNGAERMTAAEILSATETVGNAIDLISSVGSGVSVIGDKLYQVVGDAWLPFGYEDESGTAYLPNGYRFKCAVSNLSTVEEKFAKLAFFVYARDVEG